MGFVNRTFGPERMVSLTAGNLAMETAGTPQLRLDLLSGFVNDFISDFNPSALLKSDVTFVAAAPELNATYGESEKHDTVTIHQEHQGAVVLDGLIYGEFVQGPDKAGGELRRVQGRLFNPDLLPAPPEASELNLRQVRSFFGNYLHERGISGGETALLNVPVILGEKGVSGFLLTYTTPFSRDDPEPYQDRIMAVVDPATGAVTLIQSIPACRAGVPMGG
jgi:hypothetical protein